MAAFAGWRIGLLRALGAPPTPANLRALGVWQRSEGGSASYNPLNTTQRAGGAGTYNSVGVRSYGSSQQGIQATAQTLMNGRYAPVVQSLRRGAPASQTLAAVGSSPWGTNSGLLQRVLGSPLPSSGAPRAAGAGALPPTAPAANLQPARAALAQNLIAASQATSRGEAPDYSQTYQLISMLGKGATASPALPTSSNMANPGSSFRPGRVIEPASADRPGVATQPVVKRFVAEIAGLVGHPLTIGTGTNHSRMTVNGNVSDHWSGHAADIPATGAELIRLGQAALVAAGMSPAQARKQRGGLYNVGGHQIIFNTHIGGNHTNHLHVSAY